MLLVSIWLAGLTWIFWKNPLDIFLWPKTALFEIGGWFLVFWGVWGMSPVRPCRNHMARWLLCWAVLRFGYIFWGYLLAPQSVTNQITFAWFTVLPTFDLFLGSLLIYTLSTVYVRDSRSVLLLTRTVCYLSLSVSVYALLQYYGFSQWKSESSSILNDSHSMFAGLGNVSYVSMCLGMTAPLFLLFKERRYLLYLGLVLLSLWLAHRSYGLIGAGVGLLVYGLFRLEAYVRRRLWWTLLGILCVMGSGGLWISRSALFRDPRWMIWTELVRQLRQVPLTGVGCGGFASYFFVNWDVAKVSMPKAMMEGKWLWAHNDPLQLTYELGLIGGGLLLATLASTLRRSFAYRQTVLGAGWLACFMSLLVISCMNFPFHIAPTAALAIVIWAMNEVNWEEVV